MSHEPKFCELCGFMDDGTIKANALSIDGRCPFCEQAYQRGREDERNEHRVQCEGQVPFAARGDGEQA